MIKGICLCDRDYIKIFQHEKCPLEHSTGKQKICTKNLAFVHVMVKTYRFDN